MWGLESHRAFNGRPSCRPLEFFGSDDSHSPSVMDMAKKTQIQKFRDAARAAEASEDEAEFNRTLGRIARAKPADPPKSGKAPKPKRPGK